MAPPIKPKILGHSQLLKSPEDVQLKVSSDASANSLHTVRNTSQNGLMGAGKWRNQLNTCEAGDRFAVLNPTTIESEEALRAYQYGLADEENPSQTESRIGSSSVAELRDRWTKLDSDRQTEASFKNGVRKPVPVKTSPEKLSNSKSPAIGRAIEIGSLERTIPERDIAQEGIHKNPSSVARTLGQTERPKPPIQDENYLAAQNNTIPKPSRSPSPNDIFNNFKRGANNVASRGKETFQTSVKKTVTSLESLGPKKPPRDVDEGEIQMVDNNSDSIKEYITTTYGDEFYDNYAQVEAEIDGSEDAHSETVSENVSSETISSESNVKRPPIWQLPDTKKIETTMNKQFQAVKLTSQTAIETLSKLVEPVGKVARTGAVAVGQKSSDIWQASAVKGVSVTMSDDLSDFKNSVLGKPGICSGCEKLPLDHAMRSADHDADVIFKIPLERILYHSKWCRLCGYFLRHLYRAENDPFKHPQIRDFLQDEYKGGSFKTWVMSKSTLTDKNWPFGFGKVKHQGPFNYLDPILANHLYKKHAMAAWPILAKILIKVTLASRPGAKYSRTTSDQRHDERMRRAKQNKEYKEITQNDNLVHPLECFLRISMATQNDLHRGQVNVSLHAYGRGFGAKLATVSQFRLRVQAEPSLEYPLRYGLVVDPWTIDLTLGARWLHQCETAHGAACSEQSWSHVVQAPSSLRVIDVEDNCIVQVTNLHKFRFVALSYTWGSPGLEVSHLRSDNIKEMMRKNGLVPFNPWIPQTVLDAIDVVKRLSERYLWVDALCIIQDVDDEEKHQQIAAMDWLYGKAALTIVAADSEHSMAGIRGVRPQTRDLQQDKVDLKSGTLLTPIEAPKGLDKSPWNLRAWTFQERLLSRRLLIFHGGQMIWHCRSSVCHEDMIATDTGHPDSSLTWLSLRKQHLGNKGEIDGSVMVFQDQTTHVVRSSTFRQYAYLVQEYTHRRLSFSSDILKAFSGLLHILRQFFKFPMKYGLPEILLDVSLLWQPAEQLERRPSSDNAKFPSWSWAGWKGQIRYAEPFYAGVDEQKNTLLRLPLTEDEDRRQERMRPLLRYYVMNKASGQLQALNKTGLGIPLFTKNLPREWEKTPFANFPENARLVLGLSNADLPLAMLANLDDDALVFRTACVNTFDIEKSSIQDLDCGFGSFKPPLRFNILGLQDKVVGTLLLDTKGEGFRLRRKHEFILLSEAQFYGLDFEPNGNGTRHRNEYPLYNVMLVEWDEGRTVARRVGLARVDKVGWREGGPRAVIVCLR